MYLTALIVSAKLGLEGEVGDVLNHAELDLDVNVHMIIEHLEGCV